jgi:hypothetical protein
MMMDPRAAVLLFLSLSFATLLIVSGHVETSDGRHTIIEDADTKAVGSE